MGVPRNSPKPSLKKKSTTLGYLFKLESKANGVSPSPPPPPPPPPPSKSDIDELLSSISYCIFPSESPTRQDHKGHKLARILSYLRSTERPPIPDRVLSPLTAMLAANLFRPLPPPAIPFPPSDDEDAPPNAILDPSWPHLALVYDVLSALIATTDPKSVRAHVDHRFLSSLLALFQSEDPRERDRLKNAYHQLYSRLTGDRAFMRRSMSHVFLRFAYEGEQHQRQQWGIAELLEIWGSIINGLSVPMKEEHRVFLTRVLVPLHRPKGMQAYHRQLSYCVLEMVKKDPGLGGVVVKGVLRCWPLSNSHKEVLLIGEMEELVETAGPHEFDKVALPLCAQIARCLNSGVEIES